MPSRRPAPSSLNSLSISGFATNCSAVILAVATATGGALVTISLDPMSVIESPVARSGGDSLARIYALVSSAPSATPLAALVGSVESIDNDPLASYEMLNERDWDGYGAEPISAETLRYARQLLAVMPETLGPPDIAPGADGSIALEWVHDAGPLHKLFLDIGPGEEWRAYWKRRNDEFGRLPGAGFSSDTMHILLKLFEDLSK